MDCYGNVYYQKAEPTMLLQGPSETDSHKNCLNEKMWHIKLLRKIFIDILNKLAYINRNVICLQYDVLVLKTNTRGQFLSLLVDLVGKK